MVCAYAFNSLRKNPAPRGRWTMAFKDFNLVTLPDAGGLKPCCSGRRHQNACCEHPRDLTALGKVGFIILIASNVRHRLGIIEASFILHSALTDIL